MSTNSKNSPSQASNFAKKRSRDAVRENFTEIEVLREFKMKCNECKLVLFSTSSFVLHICKFNIIAKHKTALSNHWVKNHMDKEQPAKKICLFQNEGSVDIEEKFEGALEEEVEDLEDNMELTNIDFLLQ
uniref:BED-type domain-containing protein n=1 Tax=Ditylenchus dipsaci TaxID=166011 RepID=A0A915D1M1_9BILA